MAQLNSYASTLTLTIAAAAAVLVGCSADGNGGGESPYASAGGLGGAPAVGGAGVPSGGVPAAGTGATPAVGGGATPAVGGGAAPAVGAGAAPAVGAGGIPVLGAGGTPVGVAGTPAVGAGGTPVVGAGGAPGAGGATGGGTWTPQSNVDASGNLIAPAAADGFQLLTTMFDLNPGQEIFNCYHVATPNDAEFPVGEWDSQMSPGSHHFILYRADTDGTASGTLTGNGCTQGFGGSSWLYTMGAPRGHLQMPDGVAMILSAHEKLNFDMHYINTGTDVIHARIGLNVNKVKAEKFVKADAQISFNTQIAIPPNGMQTVGGDCTPASGASYFLMQTHMHKRGILATISRKLANGSMGEEIVHTTNWDSPDVKVWQQAPFLTFQAGEKFHYSCTFQNDRASVVTVGTSAANNEMCMAEAYFFPATATTPSCF
jgi:hypothetical protein